MKIRRIVSLTVFLAFIFLALSGIMLFLSPQGRVAYWAGWTLFGLSKEQYTAVHTTFMVLFLVAGIWHIVLNWKPIVGYLKDRTRRVRLFTPESSVAMALGLFFLLGPLVGLPPFKQFLDAGAGVKDFWEASSGSPPWGHAEESSLQRFCRGMEDFERLENGSPVVIDCEQALAALQAEGIRVASLTERLVDIAQVNGTTPQALGAIVMSTATPVEPGEVAPGVDAAGFYHRPYSGLGRMTMREYAEEYGYDLETILSTLRGEGLELDPDARLREEATRLGSDPEGLLDLLNEAVERGD